MGLTKDERVAARPCKLVLRSIPKCQLQSVAIAISQRRHCRSAPSTQVIPGYRISTQSPELFVNHRSLVTRVICHKAMCTSSLRNHLVCQLF